MPVEMDENVPSKALMFPSHFVEVVESLAGKGMGYQDRTCFYPAFP